MPRRRKLLQRRQRQKDRDSRLLRQMREHRPQRKGRHSHLSRRRGPLHSRRRPVGESCSEDCPRNEIRYGNKSTSAEKICSQIMQVMMNRRQAGNGRA